MCVFAFFLGVPWRDHDGEGSRDRVCTSPYAVAAAVARGPLGATRAPPCSAPSLRVGALWPSDPWARYPSRASGELLLAVRFAGARPTCYLQQSSSSQIERWASRLPAAAFNRSVIAAVARTRANDAA